MLFWIIVAIFHLYRLLLTLFFFLWALLLRLWNALSLGARSVFSPVTHQERNVVVVGGGFAGAKIAKSLESSYHVTLVDSKNYFEFTPSVLRVMVEPNHVNNIQVRAGVCMKLTLLSPKVLHREYLDLTKTTMVQVRSFTGSGLRSHLHPATGIQSRV